MYLLGQLFAVPLFLVFYITLEKTNKSAAILVLASGFIGLISLIPSRPIFELIQLSDQYKLATTDLQRIEIKSAFKATLSLFKGTAYNIHYILGTISLIISSILMIKCSLYSKATAYIGLVTNILVFTYYIPRIGG